MNEVADQLLSKEPVEPAFKRPHDWQRTAKTDWSRVAYLALLSRAMDNLEEKEGFVKYQFSAKGHELAQILLSLKLTYPFDAGSIYYRSRPFCLGGRPHPQRGV